MYIYKEFRQFLKVTVGAFRSILNRIPFIKKNLILIAIVIAFMELLTVFVGLFITGHVLSEGVLVAAQQNQAKTVDLLITLGGRTDSVDLYRTPLDWVIQYGHVDTLKVLMAHGVKCDPTDTLFSAVDRNQLEMVNLMLSLGADPNAKGNDGMSLLKIATKDKFTDIVNELKKAGARD